MVKTYSAKLSDINRRWYMVDATGKTLGRLASEIAKRLRGKHKPEYTPHIDMGDHIVVINAKNIKVTGNKAKDKIYYRHTGYPGGIKSINFNHLLKQKPTAIIEKAVRGMLPKGPLGRDMYRKLRVYENETHEHSAQQPQPLDI